MLGQLKKAAMEGVMKVMSHPAVGKVLSDERFMNLVAKGFELHGRVRGSLEQKARMIADALQLASRDQLEQIESRLQELDSRLEKLGEEVQKRSRRTRKGGSTSAETKEAGQESK
ncbi:MAG: hypothetical protein D6806_00325 [Deltaproteobacteria bacterium]|nr:MAG: hypothetical protein D6806_00325 [Deltaproteobacteria bacterium]